MTSHKAKACAECQRFNLCVVNKPPQRLSVYEFKDGRYICKNRPPEINILIEPYILAYKHAYPARDGMSGALDYSVLIKLGEAYGLMGEELGMLIECAAEAEADRPLQKTQ